MNADELLADLLKHKRRAESLLGLAPAAKVAGGLLSDGANAMRGAGSKVVKGLLGDRSPDQVDQMTRFIDRPDYYGETVNPTESMEFGATSALLATPFVGDIAGAAMDAHMYATDPASRTPFNFALSGLGVLPMIPAASQVRAARKKIKAYHGSPHDFPPVRELEMPDGAVVYQSMDDAIPDGAKMIKEHPLGRFDMSKLGSGEGAQSYGHGLYFADSEDVAKTYRDNLAPPRGTSGNAEVMELLTDPDTGAFPPDDIADTLINRYQDGESIDDMAKSLDGESGYWARKLADSEPSTRTSFENIVNDNSGSMYQVEIDATPDELLDWDLPLSEQSEKVNSRLKAAIGKFDGRQNHKDLLADQIDGGRAVGASLYSSLFAGFGNDPTDAAGAVKSTKFLQDAGIKGIKYKDGFSRGSDGGTSNYVIFDDRLISIAKKYGVSIPVAAAILTRMTGKDSSKGYQEAET